MRLLSCILLVVFSFSSLELLALEPSHKSDNLSQTVPQSPPIEEPDVEAPEGILNPDFQPECEYTDGHYDCKDFSTSYCEQFPGGRANCGIIGFCGFPDGGKGCHAANITRVLNADGTYTYCMVEPQHNSVIPGSCWIGDEHWPRHFPDHLHPAICSYYEGDGIVCLPTPAGPRLPNGPVKPQIRRKVPWTWVSVAGPGGSSSY